VIDGRIFRFLKNPSNEAASAPIHQNYLLPPAFTIVFTLKPTNCH